MPFALMMILTVAAAAAPSHGAPAGGAVLDAEVAEVFVPGGDIHNRGDILDAVPEFVAQLNLPAIHVDLGFLPSRYLLVERPGLPPLSDGTRLRPERTIQPFEQARGTVRQALDAFCRLNPSFSWRMDSRVVSLVHRGSDSTVLQTLLGARLGHFTTSNEPLAKAIIALTFAAREAASLPDDPQRWRMYHERGVPVLPPRCALDRPVTVDLTAVTVREVLHEFLRLQPGGVLLVYDEADNQAPENEARRRAEVIFTSISPERPRLPLDTLVLCLDPTYEPLHGYATKAVRADDAQRELSRRYHFHPVEVGRALMQPDGMPRIIEQAGLRELLDRTMWLYLLNNPDLSRQTIELVLALKDRDRRYEGVKAFSCSFTERTKDLCLPLWKSLTDDADPRVAARAKQMLGWWAKE
jgi:hypothetical protein